MYLWGFIAAYRLRKLRPDDPGAYWAPALPLLCVIGFVASLCAIAIGCVPPSQFGNGNPWVYVAIVGGGILLLGLVIPVLLLWARKPSWQAPAGPEVAAS